METKVFVCSTYDDGPFATCSTEGEAKAVCKRVAEGQMDEDYTEEELQDYLEDQFYVTEV